MEMEIPNGPPDNPRQVSLAKIKQEKVGKEGSRGDDSAMDEMLDSNTEQDTTGEAEGLET